MRLVNTHNELNFNTFYNVFGKAIAERERKRDEQALKLVTSFFKNKPFTNSLFVFLKKKCTSMPFIFLNGIFYFQKNQTITNK
jgi:hypothetical protein